MKLKRFVCTFLAVTVCLTSSCFFSAKSAKSETVIKEITGTASDFSLNYQSEAEMLASMTFAAENDNFRMYIHEKSLAVGLVEKSTGSVVFTNPYNAAADPLYSGEVAEQLDSQIVLSYINSENVIHKFYSSTDSVKLGQYKVKFLKDGIKVDYSLGEEREMLICPKILLEEDFKKLTADMDEFDIETLDIFYTKVDFSKTSDSDVKELLEDYSFAKGKKAYVLIDINNREQKKLDGIMRDVGYTEKEYLADIEKYGIKNSDEASPNIKLSLVYKLTENGLDVSVPRESIKFDKNTCFLQSVSVLPFFAADSEKTGDGGYLFIPDGVGAIINFANQTDNRRRLITSRVYGYDRTLNLENYTNEGKQYYLPVFGIVRNNKTALFAIITSGDTQSEITSQLGNPNSDYYTVFNTFMYTTVETVNQEAKVSVGKGVKSIFVYDKNISKDDFSISYYLLTGEKANYSSMASVYREKLIKDGMTERDFSLKLGVKTVGSALYEDSLLGFTYKKEAQFTSYSDNESIAEYLKEQGVDNISLTLAGWQKNGLDAALTNKLRFSKTLGGKSAFKALAKDFEKSATDLYVTADITGVKYDRLFDGFGKKRDTAKRMDRKYANLSEYDVSTQSYKDDGYLISPSRYSSVFRKLITSCEKNSVKNLNLASLGKQLNSDFNSENLVNRDRTVSILKETLGKLKKDYSIAFEGANSYVLPFASTLYEVSMENSGFTGESATVPFVQLATSGCIELFSQPINLSTNSQKILLECIASGVAPYYTVAYRNIPKLKATDYTEYYAISFNTVKDSAVEGYKYVSKALEKTEGSRLLSHTIIGDGVTVSVFENGTKIFVNTGKTDASVDNTAVPANSYVVA